ncbi:hypothetical protein PENTCL1PPCAC_21510, partial [Pristionchus entomophagus]
RLHWVTMRAFLLFVSFGSFITTATASEQDECREGFEQLTGDWCFHLRYDVTNQLNFEESRNYCQQKNAILPAITSVEITSALMSERTVKMGISPMDVFYIGLGCNTDTRKWMWIDGPEYDPSEAFFQRQFANKEYCSRHEPQPFVFNQFGTWSKYRNVELPLVVCAVRPTSYLPDIGAPCIGSWTQLPGGLCYYLVQSVMNPKNIVDAEMACRVVGGDLPAITSSEQSSLIQAYLAGKNLQNSNFWIGLVCELDEELVPRGITGRRAWIDGTPYIGDYTNFVDGYDNSNSCDLTSIDSFMYNGVTKGKWMKAKYNEKLYTVMCTRPYPAPMPSPSTPTTKKTVTTPDETATTNAGGIATVEPTTMPAPSTDSTTTPQITTTSSSWTPVPVIAILLLACW